MYMRVKSINNIFRLKKNEAIKDRLIRDIRELIHQKKEDYYKPEREVNFWSKSYIEYERNGDRNKAVSDEEYLDKIRPYLKDIINDIAKSDT